MDNTETTPKSHAREKNVPYPCSLIITLLIEWSDVWIIWLINPLETVKNLSRNIKTIFFSWDSPWFSKISLEKNTYGMRKCSKNMHWNIYTSIYFIGIYCTTAIKCFTQLQGFCCSDILSSDHTYRYATLSFQWKDEMQVRISIQIIETDHNGFIIKRCKGTLAETKVILPAISIYHVISAMRKDIICIL